MKIREIKEILKEMWEKHNVFRKLKDEGTEL